MIRITLICIGSVLGVGVALATSLDPPAGYTPDKKIVRLWNARCATCHGEDGRARTLEGKEMGIGDMTKAAYWKDLTLEKARASVQDGIQRTRDGKIQEMKPFKNRLTPEQIDALNIYSYSFKK